MREEQKDRRFLTSAAVILVVHTAGIIGIHSSYRELFLAATPFNLLLSISLLFWNHRDFSRPFFIFSSITFLAGFLIEVAGVKTRMIFGDYSYGNTLGPKLFEVPVIIGVNWLLLVYSMGVICNKLPANRLVKSLFGAAVLVSMDLFIERVAVEYDFWQWEGVYPPLQNFLAWFLVAFLLLLFFHSLNFRKENKLAKILFVVQMLFFMILAFL